MKQTKLTLSMASGIVLLAGLMSQSNFIFVLSPALFTVFTGFVSPSGFVTVILFKWFVQWFFLWLLLRSDLFLGCFEYEIVMLLNPMGRVFIVQSKAQVEIRKNSHF